MGGVYLRGLLVLGRLRIGLVAMDPILRKANGALEPVALAAVTGTTGLTERGEVSHGPTEGILGGIPLGTPWAISWGIPGGISERW